MALRFRDVGRIGITLAAFVVSCSNDDGGGGGTAGSSGGGMVGAGTSSGGTNSGGTSSGGTSSSGSSAGGAGSAAGGASASGSSAGGSASGAATGGGGASAGTGGGSAGNGGSGGGKSKTTFFVTSDTRTTGKLGSLEMSDKRCQDLAVAAGIGDHTFHAYLSTSTVDAKSRIGSGPWHNAKGVLIAQDLTALHSPTLKGDHTLFIDEKGQEINGQWNSSPMEDNEHDILTGTKADGTKAAATCKDWTSDDANDKGQVGHSDGMGPGMATTGTYSSWNAAHEGGSCANTEQAGGAGRIYCFAID
ncbi:MAG: hypothetical protein K0R38_1047 [Polyangiaceae bacterium]|jgi:hypothetical protein|nr:hypothetical protein [Polyangiaceae bacterium]